MGVRKQSFTKIFKIFKFLLMIVIQNVNEGLKHKKIITKNICITSNGKHI
jgi:hypothetical protein